MMNDLRERCERYRGLINRELEQTLSAYSHGSVLGDSVSYIPQAGGKRLRPILVCLAAEAAGGRGEEVLPAACAIELLHCASLALDDLPSMDNASLRRWRRPLHSVFGEAKAILTSVTLISTCFGLIARNAEALQLGDGRCAEAVGRVARGISEAAQGQAIDLELHESGVSLDVLETCYRLKTGSLLAASLTLGAVLARASDTELAVLEKFGYSVGIAFQFFDDVFDRDPRALSGKNLAHGYKPYLNAIDPALTLERAEHFAAQAGNHALELGECGEALRAAAVWMMSLQKQRFSRSRPDDEARAVRETTA